MQIGTNMNYKPKTMKKMFLTLALCLACLVISAQTPKKVVTDSVVFMPNEVEIFHGISKNGNPKWWIELPTDTGVKKVNLTESHVNSGRLLALIERKDENGKYTYSVKFAEPKAKSNGKASLDGLKK